MISCSYELYVFFKIPISTTLSKYRIDMSILMPCIGMLIMINIVSDLLYSDALFINNNLAIFFDKFSLLRMR
nr:Hypothetical_protein [Providencia rettgeri]